MSIVRRSRLALLGVALLATAPAARPAGAQQVDEERVEERRVVTKQGKRARARLDLQIGASAALTPLVDEPDASVRMTPGVVVGLALEVRPATLPLAVRVAPSASFFMGPTAKQALVAGGRQHRYTVQSMILGLGVADLVAFVPVGRGTELQLLAGGGWKRYQDLAPASRCLEDVPSNCLAAGYTRANTDPTLHVGLALRSLVGRRDFVVELGDYVSSYRSPERAGGRQHDLVLTLRLPFKGF